MEIPEIIFQEYDKLTKKLYEKELEVQKIKENLSPYKLFLEAAGLKIENNNVSNHGLTN